MNTISFTKFLKREGPFSMVRRLQLRDYALLLAGAILGLGVVLTPGFFSTPNLLSVLNSISLIGCVAVGMTLITLSGNVLSFALGVTTGASAMVFAALSAWGPVVAILGASVFAMLVTGLQGLLIGYFGANPIIVSIAALGLIGGGAEVITGGETVYASENSLAGLSSNIFGIPIGIFILGACALCAELLMRKSKFGRCILMTGSNMKAAIAAGVVVSRTILGVYCLAGLFVCASAIMLASRYGTANMEFGLGYDYQAIAAVLVGGTFIGGGEGSVVRTLIGIVIIASFSAMLLLHGISTEYQALFSGLIVLAAVLLQGKGRQV